jgi:uncharacterized protein (TIRG00374 family)
VNKRNALNLLKYVVAAAVLTYVVWSNWEPASSGYQDGVGAVVGGPAHLAAPAGKGLKYVWEHHVLTGGEGVRWDYLGFAFVLFEAGVLLTLVRWYFLVRAQDLPLTLPNAIRLGMIGCFFNAFLPGSVGGDIIKAAALAREQSRRTVAVATVLMDRIIALWGLFWFVLFLGIGFWLTGRLDGEGGAQSKLVIEITGAMLALSVAIWLPMGFLSKEQAERFALLLTPIPKIGRSAAEFWRAVWVYRCRQRSVLLAIAFSWVGFAIFILAYYYCACTLWSPEMGRIPTLQDHFILVPIGLIIRQVPGFPGGAGISEYGFGILYVWYGCKASNGILGSLVQRILEWITAVIGYVVYVAMPPAKAQTPAKAAEPEPVAQSEEAETQVWSPAQAESQSAS